MKKMFKSVSGVIASSYFYMREKISPSSIQNARAIPILINNFNRLTSLKLLIQALEERGYNHIYIIDNKSTYPPLLDYYAQCPYQIFRLEENLGFKALWLSGLNKRFCKDYYVYTDSDVIPVEDCPADFLDHFLHILKIHPLARKVGFSLRIDNLPDHYTHKQKVIDWEKQFYTKVAPNNLFRAPVDTTFALYRPRVGLSRSRYVEAYRTPWPYQAEHLPWYVDSEKLSEEEQYYIDHCSQKTAWSSRSKK